MIQATDLTFSYGDKPLYKKASFVVGKGQKVGLVGPNGSGKSTLLSIITNETNGYTGKILVSGKTALVPQEVKHDPIMEKSENVKDYVDSEGIYLEHEIKKMFFGLELDVKLNDDPKLLSGGQKTKLALARALLQNPDILLLDEPTNFMDKGGKVWVMKFLSDYKGTVIVISHDLELMDTNIDKVLAITPYDSKITEYKGTYSDYLRLKKQKEENLRKEFAIKSRHLKRMEEGYMKMRADEKKSVRRRKIEREKQNLPEIPPEIKKIKVKVPEPKRAGEVLLKAVAVDKNYDENKVLSSVTLSILRNERIAFIGVNGSGKSTLIKILAGITKPDGGEVIRDQGLSIGYYSQEFETLDFDKSVIRAFCDGTERDEGFARSYLGRFMLSGNKIFQRVESLSGGEKTRLSIAILTGKNNNLLILDEPTTYLDVLSQRIILEALKDYKGAMVVVSHTAEFIKELNPNRAVLFPEQKVVLWDEEFLDRIGEV